MNILLVNDDGILAPGLAALHEAVRELGTLSVVAPDSPQSAAARSITLHAPMVCQQVHVDGRFWGTGVGGRPADCVKLAVRELLSQRPDLVLSGINAGANVGVNIFYSGTVAAAAEGALLGIPSVAFSLQAGDEMDFRRAAGLCRWVLQRLLEGVLQPGELVNVNIPMLGGPGPRGLKVVPQSTAAITESYSRKDGSDGQAIFQLREHFDYGPEQSETDVTALEEGYITVTPLKSDLTDRLRMGHYSGVRWGNTPQ